MPVYGRQFVDGTAYLPVFMHTAQRKRVSISIRRYQMFTHIHSSFAANYISTAKRIFRLLCINLQAVRCYLSFCVDYIVMKASQYAKHSLESLSFVRQNRRNFFFFVDGGLPVKLR